VLYIQEGSPTRVYSQEAALEKNPVKAGFLVGIALTQKAIVSAVSAKITRVKQCGFDDILFFITGFQIVPLHRTIERWPVALPFDGPRGLVHCLDLHAVVWAMDRGLLLIVRRHPCTPLY